MQVVLLLNAVVYLLSRFGLREYVLDYGAFIPSQAEQLWRFLSYAFVHVDFWHFLVNMLMFWMFAPDVCKELGEKNFTALYLLSAVFAGGFGLPFYFSGLMAPNPIIGASGALFGVMAAYALLFPDRIILMLFIIPMKIKYAIWVFIAIDLFMIGSNDGISHFTHLGGIFSGYLFMLARSKRRSTDTSYTDTYSREFFREQASRNKPRQSQQSKPLEGELSKPLEGELRKPLEGELYVGSSNAKEERLNEILEKINLRGLQSLNQEERDYLQWFGQQNKRRS